METCITNKSGLVKGYLCWIIRWIVLIGSPTRRHSWWGQTVAMPMVRYYRYNDNADISNTWLSRRERAGPHSRSFYHQFQANFFNTIILSAMNQPLTAGLCSASWCSPLPAPSSRLPAPAPGSQLPAPSPGPGPSLGWSWSLVTVMMLYLSLR